MKYKTLIFDLDGTLLDTIRDLANAVNFSLRKNGYPVHELPAFFPMVGNGVANLVARALPGGAENPDYSRVYDDFRAYYSEHKEDETAPYDGILPMLSRLFEAGLPMAIVSNKFDAAVKSLAATYFGDTVKVAVGESETVARKPAPDAVFVALRELGVSPCGAVFIGDSEVDIETAKAAGLPCLSVSWGFRSEAVLKAAGAEAIFHTPSELAEHLLSE